MEDKAKMVYIVIGEWIKRTRFGFPLPVPMKEEDPGFITLRSTDLIFLA